MAQLVFRNVRPTDRGCILVDKCLKLNPDLRPTARHVVHHQYFADDHYCTELSTALEHVSQEKQRALVVDIATPKLSPNHNQIIAYCDQHAAPCLSPLSTEDAEAMAPVEDAEATFLVGMTGRCSGSCGAALCERNKKLIFKRRSQCRMRS